MTATATTTTPSAGAQRRRSKAVALTGVFLAGTAAFYSPVGLDLARSTNAGARKLSVLDGRLAIEDAALVLDPVGVVRPSGDRVADLKAASGLTWAQVAQLFAVSPRSVHLWVAGGRLTSQHEERLATLCNRVAGISDNGAQPRDVRSRLLAPRGPSPSIFASWVLEVRPRIAAEGFTPGELFADSTEGPYEPAGRFEEAQKVDWPGVT